LGRYFSPAKLNLFFRVLGRRNDGFHEIASLYQAIDLGDTLEVEKANEDEITCSDPTLPCDEKNLVVKALQLFRQRTGLASFHVRCRLEKKVPMEAGLGGGSSNAATMLYACNDLASSPASLQELATWGAELGSDVAFFFSSGSAYCTGRGEKFTDQPLLAQRILIPGATWMAKPAFGVSTQRTYQACRPETFEKRDPLAVLDSFLSGSPLFFNDLEHSAFQICPALCDVKRSLQESGFPTVVMTGSGSAFICIGLSAAPKIDKINGLAMTPVLPLQRQAKGWYDFPSEVGRVSMQKKDLPDSTIVITGAAGFIGSGIVRHLNEQGRVNLVLVDDIGTSEKWKNLLGKRFREIIPIQGLFSWLQGKEQQVSAFIHLGACSDTLETNVDYLLENNTRYTIRLAEYALRHGQRFIYASSAATYGDGSLGFVDAHEELHSLKPLNPYGYSKHLFDLWALEHGCIDKMVGLKYFNVYGPNENHKGRMASMVCKMAPQVTKEGVIRLFKSTEPNRFPDGGQCRDFIYVKDVARMTCDFLHNDIGGVFNIGAGQPATWNELAVALFKAMNRPVNIEYIEMPADLARQYQNYTCADMTKFLKTMGYKKEQPITQYSLEEAVRDYVQGYLLKDAAW
jgi:ADP-L-glycero-D-manno-heptose 6-epimerase